MKIKLSVLLALLVLVVSACSPRTTYDLEAIEQEAAAANSFTIDGTIMKIVEITRGKNAGTKKLLVTEGDVLSDADYKAAPMKLVQSGNYSKLYWVEVESLEGYEQGQKVTVITTDKPKGNLPFQTIAKKITIK